MEVMEAETRAARFARCVPSKPTLNMAEACAILRCSDAHIRHLIEDGSLVAVNVACKGCRPNWRIERASLLNFLQERVS